jgi:ribonuclease P protein component
VASDAGFPPSVRLRKPAEFKQVSQQGRRSKRALLTAGYTAGSAGSARLGLAIAKKSVPLAVQRNRVKRLIRDAFRKNQARLPAVDLVFYASPGISRLDNDAIRALIADVWTQVIERCARHSSSPSASTSAR